MAATNAILPHLFKNINVDEVLALGNEGSNNWEKNKLRKENLKLFNLEKRKKNWIEQTKYMSIDYMLKNEYPIMDPVLSAAHSRISYALINYRANSYFVRAWTCTICNRPMNRRCASECVSSLLDWEGKFEMRKKPPNLPLFNTIDDAINEGKNIRAYILLKTVAEFNINNSLQENLLTIAALILREVGIKLIMSNECEDFDKYYNWKLERKYQKDLFYDQYEVKETAVAVRIIDWEIIFPSKIYDILLLSLSEDPIRQVPYGYDYEIICESQFLRIERIYRKKRIVGTILEIAKNMDILGVALN
eukprot:Awhi_evm4s3140